MKWVCYHSPPRSAVLGMAAWDLASGRPHRQLCTLLTMPGRQQRAGGCASGARAPRAVSFRDLHCSLAGGGCMDRHGDMQVKTMRKDKRFRCHRTRTRGPTASPPQQCPAVYPAQRADGDGGCHNQHTSRVCNAGLSRQQHPPGRGAGSPPPAHGASS